MRCKRFVATAALAAATSGIAACSGSSSPPAPSSANTTTPPGNAAGRGNSPTGGVVNVTSYSNNDGPSSVAVLTGAIADFGHAVRTAASSGHHDRLSFKVSHGSFALNITTLETKLVRAFAAFPTDASTCSGEVVVHGQAPIVAGSGTGSYRRIAGTFALTVTTNEVDPWPNCPPTRQALITQTVFVTGSGTVSFT